MKPEIPAVLREVAKPRGHEWMDDNAVQRDDNAVQRYGYRCMAAALRWALSHHDLWGNELSLNSVAEGRNLSDAIAALDAEATP